jgi:hypothetical protein
MPAGRVSAFPPYAGAPEQPLWSDSEIKQALSSPDRRDVIELFPFEKYGTDQHSTSACNGWAAAGAMTRARKLRGLDDGWVGSGSFIYSWINGGRDNGSILEDGMEAVQERGCCSIELQSYDKIFQRSPEAVRDGLKHRGLSAFVAKTRQGWDSALATGLYMGVAAVHCGPSFDRFTKPSGGRWSALPMPGVQNGPGNHAVAIEDIDWNSTLREYEYLMPNSWGIRYGLKGRVRLRWAHFQQCFPNHVFYLLPITREVMAQGTRSAMAAA